MNTKELKEVLLEMAPLEFLLLILDVMDKMFEEKNYFEPQLFDKEKIQ